MRICHVITRLIIGGAQENTVLTCRGLSERGHDVTLVAGPETGPEGSLWSRVSEAGFETAVVHSLRRAVNPISDRRAMGDLRALFERIRPDIVHTHSSKAGILGRFAAASSRIPVIVHTIHGMSFNRTQPLALRVAYRALEKRAARRTTAFVTVADAMTDQAVASGLAPRSRFLTVRSGIETDLFSPCPESRERVRGQWNVGEGDIVVGTIARLFRNKGYDEIIAAMPAAVARQPRLRFVWVGDGDYRHRYERRLEDIGLRDHVRFTGLVDPGEVARIVNGFDMVLHASRWEGLPRALVQGLLTGVPAISFDNDGAPEVVIPKRTGVLVPLGNIELLSRAVVELAESPALRGELGRHGRRHCLELFDWTRMVDTLEALYDRLLGSTG